MKSEVNFIYSDIDRITKGRFAGDIDFMADIIDDNSGEHIGKINFQICHNEQAIVPGEYLPEYLVVNENENENEDGITFLKTHLYVKRIIFDEAQRGKGYLRKVFRELIHISKNNNAEGRIILEAEALCSGFGSPHKFYYAIGMEHGPKYEEFLRKKIKTYGANVKDVTIGKDGKLQYCGYSGVVLCLKPEVIDKM